MIIVLASRLDESARALVAKWKANDAIILTAQDLSTSGWRFYTEASRAQVAVVGGEQVLGADIQGVVTRFPRVFETELPHICGEDRSYVASEMTAFLLAWLARLACPVLNRPIAGSLSGPFWRPEQWIHAAAQVGIPVRPLDRSVRFGGTKLSESSDESYVTVTVLGDRSFGSVDVQVGLQARRLADTAQVDLLECRFSAAEAGSSFLGVNPWPSLETEGLAEGLLEYFVDRQRVEPGARLRTR